MDDFLMSPPGLGLVAALCLFGFFLGVGTAFYPLNIALCLGFGAVVTLVILAARQLGIH
jgi:hypothetical protein